ncbi:MAG: hypothetical protein JW889_11400 [Verrucomicrobia bacterium]|nr:hypothetical protein [Verrucomicrobiota bacterium]
MKTARARTCLPVIAACVALLMCGWADAREIWSSDDGGRTADLVTAFKQSTLISDDDSLTGLCRLRFALSARLGADTTVEAAYEQRLRTLGSPPSGDLAVLPSQADAPYRIVQLDDAIRETDAYGYRHELDRALAALHDERASVTVGRQAVGWGKGVLFSGIDVFAPFSPLEVDREWRRGIDAIRADVRLGDTASLDVVGAFGESWDDSALLGRLRARTASGLVDAEFIAGKRAEDTMFAGAFSATVGDAAVHGELALFDTPDGFADGGLFGGDDLVAKAVLGASYTFNIGNGLTVWAEYHFSGFGSDDMALAQQRLADPAYVARILRGDTQILGRRAAAIQTSYLVDDLWTVSLVWIANPDDGSGVLAPSAKLTLSDNVTILGSFYVPYGDGLDAAGTPQSEYGAAPSTVFLQLAIYN